MKKNTDIHKAISADNVSSPAPAILYSASIILSLIYLCGIILLLLPGSVCDSSRAAECAEELFSVSYRVIVLSAAAAFTASIIDMKYPDNDN